MLNKLSISNRLRLAFGSLVLLMIFNSLAGFYGTNKISGVLDFVMNRAWNAADGAMEGTIGLQAELLAIERILAGYDIALQQSRIQEARGFGREAISRMVSANLVKPELIAKIDPSLQKYTDLQENLLTSYKLFHTTHVKLMEDFTEFQQFMVNVEEMGDSQIEILRNNPDVALSWNGGLEEKWTSADSGMETSIELLSRFFYYQRLVSIDANEDPQMFLKDLEAALENLQATAAELAASPFMQAQFPGSSTQTSYADILQQFISQHEEDFVTAVEALLQLRGVKLQYVAVSEELLDLIGIIEEAGDGQVEGQGELVNQTKQLSTFTIVLTLLLAIAFAIVLGWWIIRSITPPLSDIANVANELSQGNLNVTINSKSDDEIGTVAKSVGVMTQKLRQIIQQIVKISEQVSTDANTISSSSKHLSDGAISQASSLEEASSAMQLITTQIQHNADNAAQASKLAEQARKSAEVGNQQMQQMQGAMNDINHAAESISNIIQTIDEIAFQTNLLALNAAVEAARAGEQGRGFAVVAGEVRNLAQRSATAAKETSTLIKDSISKISHGVTIANDTAVSLTEIVTNSIKVNDLITEINMASKEQTNSSREINQGLTQLNSITQQNTSIAQDVATGSAQLNNEAKELHQVVRFFRS